MCKKNRSSKSNTNSGAVFIVAYRLPQVPLFQGNHQGSSSIMIAPCEVEVWIVVLPCLCGWYLVTINHVGRDMLSQSPDHKRCYMIVLKMVNHTCHTQQKTQHLTQSACEHDERCLTSHMQ